MSSSSFRDNFSYFAAFIAVLFGLGVFRDELSTLKFDIFFGSFSIFQVALIFLGIMILAMYVGALAILSKSFLFRPIPLTKILENISNTLAALGLLYPLLVILIYASGLVASLVPSTFTQNVLVTSVSALLTGIAIGAAIKYASDRFIRRYEAKLSDLRKKVVTEDTPLNTSKVTPYEIVMLYHQFVSLARSILNLKGYGSSGENIYSITSKLVSLDILKASDLKTVKKIQSIRNRLVHTDKTISTIDLKAVSKDIQALTDKLKKSLLALDTNDKSSKLVH